MVITTINSESHLLVLAPARWDLDIKLTPAIPVHLIPAKDGQEGRIIKTGNPRYTLEFTADLSNPAHATAAEVALAEHTTEPVACPLVTDQLVLAADVNAGSNTLTFNDNSIRETSCYLVKDWPGDTWEIVQKSNISGGTLTITGTLSNAWAAGSTYIYPLLFGEIDRQKSRQGINPQENTIPIHIAESSEYADRITLQNVSLSTIGTTIPAKSTVRLFDQIPDWRKSTQYDQIEIETFLLGYNRRSYRFADQEYVRRGQTMQFTCTTRAQILQIEALFADCSGPASGFFYPSHRQDMVLTADIPQFGSTNITVQNSPWTAAFNAAGHPQYPYLAAIDTAQVMPMLIASASAGGSEDTLTMTTWANKAFSQAATMISFLYFGRFKESSITWKYLSDTQAVVTVELIELPHEYATIYTPGKRANLFKFTRRKPNGNDTYRFASWDDDIAVVGDGTYTPAPIKFRNLRRDFRLEDEEVTLESAYFSGNPLADGLGRGLPFPLDLEILTVDPASPTTTKSRFKGEIVKVGPKGRLINARAISWKRKLEQRYPNILIQRHCNYRLGQGCHAVAARRTACALNIENYAQTGEFREISGSSDYTIYVENHSIPTWSALTTYAWTDPVIYNSGLWVSIANSNLGNTPALPSNYWILKTYFFGNGRIHIGTGSDILTAGLEFVGKDILSSDLIITLSTKLSRTPAQGEAVTLYPGCAGAFGDCYIFNNVRRWGAHPGVPQDNPSRSEESFQGGTGKKG